MTEKEPAQNSQRKCLICQATSQEKVLLRALDKDEEVWVCVHCLPMLIHGSH